MGMLADSVARRGNSHPSILERYTDATRDVLYFAQLEAARRGAAAVSVADLLSGLGVAENTRAERVGNLKANALYLRWLVGSPALPAWNVATQEIEASALELDAEAKRALGFTVLEADRDREYWIDSDHILRGLMRFPNKADFAILKTELSLKTARVASRVDREEHLSEINPSLKVMQYLVRKWATVFAPPVLSLACYLYILMQGLSMSASAAVR
jgi:hypothetical protein